MRYILRFLLLTLAVLQASLAQAQSARETGILFGIGRASVYDTYLSPVTYRGPQMHLEANTWRTLKRNPDITFQTTTRIHLAYTHNRVQTANGPDARLSTDLGWSRRWSNALPRLDLSVGGLWGLELGGTYNTQNGNNPAQGRAATQLSVAANAKYHIPLRHRTLTLQYMAYMPLLGMMFSPQYGQSYYSLFYQGNWDKNIVCTHPGNALSLYQRFTVSLPCKRRTLTVGYQSTLHQAKPHYLRQHHYTRSFVIGWTLFKDKSKTSAQ